MLGMQVLVHVIQRDAHVLTRYRDFFQDWLYLLFMECRHAGADLAVIKLFVQVGVRLLGYGGIFCNRITHTF